MKSIARILFLLFLSFSSFARAQVPTQLGWYSIPNTKIDDGPGGATDICAVWDNDPNHLGTGPYFSLKRDEGCSAITNDWNSAVFDTQNNRMIIWGAGHNGYWGNEVYALNLTQAACGGGAYPCIRRLNNPTIPSSSCTDTNAQDDTPTGRHTNDQIVYVGHLNQMYNKGGAYNCINGGITQGAWSLRLNAAPVTCNAPSAPCDLTPANSGWLTRTASCGSVACGSGATYAIAYDPNTRLVWAYNDTSVTLYSYNPDTDVWTNRGTGSGVSGAYRRTAIVDPVRRRFILIGNNEVVWWDLNRSSQGARTIQTTTGPQNAVNYLGPGCAYDDNTQTILCWQAGNTVYRLNPDTWVWTQETYSGGPSTSTANGTYKRFAYSRTDNMFVTCNGVGENCFALRTSTATTGLYDFTGRCATYGVIRCWGFDDQSNLSPNGCTQAGCWSTQPYGWLAGQATISLDANIKASGNSAFRLDIAAGQNGNAAFFGNFSNDYSTQFGANQTFYVSFRQYMGPGYTESYSDSSNAKQFFVGTGSIGTGSSNSATSCTFLEILFESFYGVLGHYNHCPPTNNWNEPFSGTNKLQTARPSPFCLHSQTPPGGGASDGSSMFPPNGNCWKYHEGEWMTFKLRLDIGSGPTSTGCNGPPSCWIGSRGRTWAAYDGEAFEAITDWQFGVSTTVQHAAGTAGDAPIGAASKYGQIWATARNDTSWSTAPVYTLYDEIIISTQDIAAPGQTQTPASPAAPTGFKVTNP